MFNLEGIFEKFETKKFVDDGGRLVRKNCHEAKSHHSGIITLCPFEAPTLVTIVTKDDKTVNQCDTLTIHQLDQIYTNPTTCDFLTEGIIVGTRLFAISNANDSCGVDDSYTISAVTEFLTEAIIVTTWIHAFSGTAANRSDLPGVVTSNVCPDIVRHETNCDKTIAVEHRKDSGRVGPLGSFKNDFQNTVDFPSPKDGMVGWQNAHCDKQKHNENRKPVFRPFQQQQHEATALELSEVAHNDESGSYTSDGMYKDLEDGMYEKTIYVKTWTGRTITAVFSLEKVTKIVK